MKRRELRMLVVLLIILAVGVVSLIWVKKSNWNIQKNNPEVPVAATSTDLLQKIPVDLNNSRVVGINMLFTVRGKIASIENNRIQIVDPGKLPVMNILPETKVFQVQADGKTAKEVDKSKLAKDQNVLLYINYDPKKDRTFLTRVTIIDN